MVTASPVKSNGSLSADCDYNTSISDCLETGSAHNNMKRWLTTVKTSRCSNWTVTNGSSWRWL